LLSRCCWIRAVVEVRSWLLFSIIRGMQITQILPSSSRPVRFRISAASNMTLYPNSQLQLRRNIDSYSSGGPSGPRHSVSRKNPTQRRCDLQRKRVRKLQQGDLLMQPSFRTSEFTVSLEDISLPSTSGRSIRSL
jgi:hypothetical protein